jgi:type II secretory ATPase GspE/PulE/Tfp pilus assembly ATPase PilB-like protein
LGRTAIYEMMAMSERIERLASDRATTAEIRAAARAEGMRTLQESGFLKVAAGMTSLEEVLRVTLVNGEGSGEG